MSETQYRLLSLSESAQAGDEVFSLLYARWDLATPGLTGHPLIRRKLEATTWIPIAERPPVLPCEVGRWAADSKFIIRYNESSSLDPAWTYWRAIIPPPKPPELSEAEKALKLAVACAAVPSNPNEAYIAGFEHAKEGDVSVRLKMTNR